MSLLGDRRSELRMGREKETEKCEENRRSEQETDEKNVAETVLRSRR